MSPAEVRSLGPQLSGSAAVRLCGADSAGIVGDERSLALKLDGTFARLSALVKNLLELPKRTLDAN